MTILFLALSLFVTFMCVAIVWTIIGANFVNRNYEVAAGHGIVLGAVLAVVAPIVIGLVTQSWEATLLYSWVVSAVAAVPVVGLVGLIAFLKILRS